MMKNTILVFVLLVTFFSISGQSSKYKFGKVSAADLAMTSYDADPEANAIILSDIGLIQYDNRATNVSIVRFHHVVIKILNKHGAEEYGNITIPYYAYNRESFITNLKAMVHLPDGTDIKLKGDQLLDEEINLYYKQKKIIFPAVAEGAILEYEYQLTSTNIFSPVNWFLQGKSPIIYAELIVLMPNWYEYVVLTQGQSLFKYDKTQQADTGGEIIYNKWYFVSENVPALKEEKYITTMDDYYSRVRFRLNSYQFPSRPKEHVLETWEKVSDRIWAIPAFGYQLNNKGPGELVLEAAGMQKDESISLTEKAKQVYQYINREIEYDGYESLGLDSEIREILKKRSGSSGQLNKLMLAALLQLGIEAYPVMISTRTNGRTFELYPFTEQFDRMLVLAKLEGKDIWIDLGNHKRPMGMIAANSMNARGWVAAKKSPYWTDLPLQESKTILLLKGSLTEEGVFHGEVEGRFTGFHALEYRSNYAKDKTAFLKDHLSYSQSFATIKDIQIINESEVDLPFQIKGIIESLQLGEVGNNKIYLPLLQLKSLVENPFRQESRQYPVEFNFPEDYTVIFDIVLPEDVVVESLPTPAKYTTDQSEVQVSLQSSATYGKLNLITKYAVKSLMFDPRDYHTLKHIYGLRKELFSEQIVLSKQP